MKKAIAMLLAILSLFLLSGCQESPSDQLKRLQNEAEEKRKYAEQKRKEAEDLEKNLNIIKQYQNNH